MKDTIYSYTKSIGSIIIIFAILYIVFNFIPPFSEYNTYVIQTNSMEPVINVGDMVFIKDTEIDDLSGGDIIAFYVDINNDNNDEVVVHYLNQIITDQNGTKTFKTKPEISDQIDSWTIEENDIVGIYEFKINSIGSVLMFFQTIPGIAVLLLNVWIIFYVIDFFKSSKKCDSKDENTNETTQ